MITSSIISAAIGAISNSEGAKKAGKELSVAVWDFIRPLFLKDDPAEGAKELAAAEAAPSAPATQEKITSLLTEHLESSPEAANQLQQIMQQHGGSVVNNYGDVKQQINDSTFEGPVTFN